MTDTNIPAAMQAYRRSAWKPVVTDGDGDLTASKFSGKPWLAQDEDWPRCLNCGKPIQMFVQLNLDELPGNLSGEFGHGLLQFYYCTDHESFCEQKTQAWSPFSKGAILRIVRADGEAGKSAGDIEIPPIEDFIPPKVITGWEEADDYPNWEEGQVLGIRLAQDEKENDNAWDELGDDFPLRGDKLVGWPDWVQNVEYPSCPVCEKKMQLVFQIASFDNTGYMFGDAGTGHITQCETHLDQLAFGWACC